MATKSSERLAFFFTEDKPWGSTHWKVTVVAVEDHPTRIRLNGEPDITLRAVTFRHPLEGFEAWTWATRGDNGVENPPYTFSAEFRSVGSVDLNRAQSMVKVLSKLDRGMTADYNEFGNTAHFGQYVMRVGRALGIREVAYKVKDGAHGYRWDDGTYRLMPLGQASDYIAREIGESISEGRAIAA